MKKPYKFDLMKAYGDMLEEVLEVLERNMNWYSKQLEAENNEDEDTNFYLSRLEASKHLFELLYHCNFRTRGNTIGIILPEYTEFIDGETIVYSKGDEINALQMDEAEQRTSTN